MSVQRRARGLVEIVCLGWVFVLLVTICSSSSSGASTVRSVRASSSGVAAAKAALKKAEIRPTSIGLSKPVGKPIPTGKKVTWISCGTPSCEIQGQIAEQAAKILGWQATTINTNGTPQQIQAAWEQALQANTNAIMLSATPNSEIEAQIKQAEQKGVAYVGDAETDPIGPGSLNFVTLTPQQNAVPGKIMAAAVIADGGNKANALYVNLPAFPILAGLGNKFSSQFKSYCPKCGLSTLNVPVTALGQSATNMIVTYLRGHPAVNYVVLSVDSAFSTGLPTALSQAGLSGKVKILGEGPDTTSLQYIAQSEEFGTVNTDIFVQTFQMMDALARKFAGVPILENEGLPWWWITKSNLPSATKLEPSVANYVADFKKLWGK
jgi:ribose transport system substrate-binding protein